MCIVLLHALLCFSFLSALVRFRSCVQTPGFSPAHFSPPDEVQTAFALVVLVFGRHEGLFVLD